MYLSLNTMFSVDIYIGTTYINIQNIVHVTAYRTTVCEQPH
jgi:hypothetical protein